MRAITVPSQCNGDPETIRSSVCDARFFQKKRNERYPVYEQLFKIFQPTYASPYRKQMEQQCDFDHSRTYDLLQDVTRVFNDCGSVTAAEINEANALVPAFYGVNNTDQDTIWSDINRVIEVGVNRCKQILEVICIHLIDQGKMNLVGFRAHLKAGMNFASKLASLSKDTDGMAMDANIDQDERETALPAPISKPLNNFVLTRTKLDFTDIAKTRFAMYQTWANEVRKKLGQKSCGCPYKFLKLNLDINGNNEETRVNGVQAFYWLFAKKVEQALFSKQTTT